LYVSFATSLNDWLKVTFLEAKSAIEKETLRKGKFIVATNLLDRENLSDEEVLNAYKEQEYA